jgi:hypothetical protein
VHQSEKTRVDRRTFIGESAGMVVGGLGCIGSLEGLRAALAVAMAQQKPLLTELSLNAFLAEARPSKERLVMAKEAAADLRGFLGQHFVVEGKCERVLSSLSTDDTAKINQAIQEGFAGQNQLQVAVANVDLPNAPAPRVGVVRATRAVRGEMPMAITTITIGP